MLDLGELPLSVYRAHLQLDQVSRSPFVVITNNWGRSLSFPGESWNNFLRDLE